jgi:D-alanine-D-alanine ligase
VAWSIGLCFDSKEEYLADGYSALDVMEFDDEGVIGSLEDVLTGLGHRVERIGRGRNLAQRLALGERWDLLFNFAEGLHGRGREAQVPAVCELFEQPYTFSDPVTCGVTLDKAWAKHIVRDAGLPTPDFAVIRRREDAEQVTMSPPLFVKPVAEGSSKGVTGRSIVERADSLATLCGELLPTFPEGLLVERFLPGREITVGVVGNGASARAVAAMEVVWTERAEVPAYTALNKDEWVERISYRLVEDQTSADEATALALAVTSTLQCRDVARVDLRADASGRLSFLEVNPLPGLHPVRSDLPIMARLAGIAYKDLLAEILEAAAVRYGLCACAT